MRWLALICLAALPALAEERKLAVVPIPGVLERADAAALEDEVRKEARALEIEVVDDAPASIEAAGRMGATHAVVGRSERLEGALGVSLWLVRVADGQRLAMERLVGFLPADLHGKNEARKKLPRLLRNGFGLGGSAATAPPTPTSTPASAPNPTPTPTPTPTPMLVPTPPWTPPPPAPPPPPPPPRASRPPPGETRVTGAEDSSPLVRTIREVISQVEDVRGLRRKSTLQVAILGDESFSKALRAKAEKELTPQVVAIERARWVAFGLAPASADPAKILLGVLDEQVAGFYDPSTKALTVREKPPASTAGAGPDAFRQVLAHEIQHALQDQNFGFPDMAALPDDDARLARMALYEGDAMATMTAVAARAAKQPVKLALSTAAAMFHNLTAGQLAQMAGYSPELLQAPAVLREELALPYISGMALVAEVHRRGGFALVDKMFQHPPLTTHQVLHPDAYLSGELPARVPPPPPPPGLQPIASGRMGELGTRLALQICVDEQVARDFAQSWAGDAYTIVKGPLDTIALVWSTAWSGNGARTFANLLGMQTPCWEETARAPHEGSYSIPAAAEVRLEGAKVALARGFSAPARGTAAARALEFDPRIPPPVPPLGAVREDPAAVRPRVVEGRFLSPRLAVQGEVPPGFEADLEQPQTEIVLRKPRVSAVASLALVPEAVTPEALDGFFQSAAAAFATQAGGSSLKLRGAQRTRLLGAAAQERAWEVDGTHALLRITLAPACAGRGYYAVLRAGVDEATRAALERFVSSLRPLGTEESPACAELQ